MRLPWPRALLISIAALLLIEVFVVAPHPAALAVVATVAWAALPGVAVVRAVAGPGQAGTCGAWAIGPAIGFGLSVFGMLPLWAAGLHNWVTILVGPCLTWAIAWALGRSGGLRVRWAQFDRRDTVAMAIALAVVPLITWAPYDHVREVLPEGEAYRAYFTADFVWAMSVTAEIGKGQVPLVNPFLRGAGETLNYYWLAHFLSGATYRNLASWGVTAEQVILINGLAFGTAFVAFMYALARMAGASAAFAALAVFVGFCANSYEALNRIWVVWERGGSLDVLKEYNIDAVTRWFYQGMPVDGLQRLLLYQPHHLTGYVMGLAALWLVGLAEDASELGVALSAGVLLGMAFLFSTFGALILGAAIAVIYLYRLIQQRAWRAIVPCAIFGGGPAIVGVLLTSVLGYTDRRAGNLLQLGLNPVATHHWPLVMLLSFGPLLFAGVVGSFRLEWARREGSAAIALVVVALAFYFFVDVRDMDGVWVGWRSGHQLLIAFSIMGAAALTAAWNVRRARVALVALTILLCLPAVPTVALDVYNAQDIWNRTEGPTFPWTVIITREEREALDWVKRSTAPTALVQFEPDIRGAAYWAYLPAFAERRMSAGLPGAMIPFKKYQQASDTVRLGVFMAPSASDAHTVATRLGIDYIFVGEIERKTYRGAVGEMAAHPELFPIAFKNDAVTIFAVPR